MNINRISAGLAVAGTGAARSRVDATVADAGISRATSGAAAINGQVEPVRVTSSPALQAVLSTAETAALQTAFGSRAAPAVESAQTALASGPGAGAYSFHGGRPTTVGTGRLGGLVDFSG